MAFGRKCGRARGRAGAGATRALIISSVLSRSASRSRQGSDVRSQISREHVQRASGQLSLPHPATARSDLGCGNGVHRGLWRKR